MPLATAMPSERRALAPAPLASTSGITPRMKVNEVIMMGRKRTLEPYHGVEDALPAGAAFARHLDDQNRVLRRQSDQQDQADLHINIVGKTNDVSSATTVPSNASGTARITATGVIQLSYCPASAK